MAWTTPNTSWADGNLVDASDMNDIGNNLDYLYNRPVGARVYNSSNISVSDSSLTALTFDSERFDTDDMHDLVTNTGRLTFTTAGKYLVKGQVEWSGDSNGRRELTIRLNGATILAQTTIAPAGTADMGQEVSTIYDFAATDYVELLAYQDSGGSRSAKSSANYSPEFMAMKLAEA
jgi:hypothetical protein